MSVLLNVTLIINLENLTTHAALYFPEGVLGHKYQLGKYARIMQAQCIMYV